MAIKFDKEILIKHHFWILSGVFFLLALIPLLLLGASVSAKVNRAKEDLSSAEKSVTGIKDPKNQNWVNAYQEQDKKIDKKKHEVWKQAWETQKDLMTFPEAMTAVFKGKYFGDELDKFDREKFRQQYAGQLKGLKELVQLVDWKGDGVVQITGGSEIWGEFLGLRPSFKLPPSSNDIWLAQEDLWVKRELLRVVRDANDSVARFKEIKPGTGTGSSKPDPVSEPISFSKTNETPVAPVAQTAKSAPAIPGDSKHKIFRNQYWELDLSLSGEGGKYVLGGKLTNISKRRQTLGETDFKVFLQDRGSDSATMLLPINGEPMAASESQAIKSVPVPEHLTVDGLFGVEQVLTWRTAPVKRIDALEMDYNSSRVSVPRFVGPRFIQGGTAAPRARRGGKSGAAGVDAAGDDDTGDAPTTGGISSTESGLKVPRYMDVNEQVRHMPVAMMLVIREENVPEVLAAFTNSKLRIQVTQIHWQHFRESVQPVIQEEPPEQPQEVAQATPRRRPGGKGEVSESGPGGVEAQQRSRTGRAGKRSGGAPTFRLGPNQGSGISLGGSPKLRTGPESVDQEEDMGLIEVSVYGIASLYERYPPKPTSDAPGTPASTTKEPKKN
jgi:hypothetical protein